jgi:hypothetical protein
MNRKWFVLLAIMLCLALFTLSASGAIVTTHMTVDDAFELYLSTDDSQLGTFIGSGNTWTTTYTFTLTPSTTNYIHVVGHDVYRVIAGFIGDFSLDDSNYQFVNGSQSLVTNSADWVVSATGFGSGYTSPDAYASNGDGPWGFRNGISADAKWIWTNDGMDLYTARYFSTPVINIPEPITIIIWSLLGGLGIVFAWRRRRVA